VSVTLIEKPERQGDSSATSGSGKWEYVARVSGESNPESALIAAIITDTGWFWYNLAVKQVSFQELGGSLYSATVDWVYEVPNGAAQDPTQSPGAGEGPGGTTPSGTPSGPASEDERLGPNISLEIGGRPPKLMQSRDVVASEQIGGGGAPFHGKLLNIEDGKPEGVEIEDPASVLTIEIQFDYITVKYIRLLYSAVWHTNDADWWFFPEGEVAFMGCTLQSNGSGRVNGVFRFGVRPTETILAGSIRDDAGGELPTVDYTKFGWNYLELDYEDVDPATSGFPVTVSWPFAYRIHQLLPTLDFTTRGIGG
jgi:hypothetical protein